MTRVKFLTARKICCNVARCYQPVILSDKSKMDQVMDEEWLPENNLDELDEELSDGDEEEDLERQNEAFIQSEDSGSDDELNVRVFNLNNHSLILGE